MGGQGWTIEQEDLGGGLGGSWRVPGVPCSLGEGPPTPLRSLHQNSAGQPGSAARGERLREGAGAGAGGLGRAQRRSARQTPERRPPGSSPLPATQ